MFVSSMPSIHKSPRNIIEGRGRGKGGRERR
jgi:hypothetical protein